MGKIIVARAGALTTIQDLGRPYHQREGIGRGGALDLQAARVANLLVGNSEDAALLEISLGNVRLRFRDERVTAWCGAEASVKIGEENIPAGHPIHVFAEEEIVFGSMTRGCRIWLAASSGIAVPKILESRATDLRARFGGLDGRALRDGDELPLGEIARAVPFRGRIANWNAPNEWTQPASMAPLLRVIPGVEWSDFTIDARTVFLRESFSVTAQSDRMGTRLRGPELRRGVERELLSEAVAPGTIQVANDHQPILLLGDCQTVGGYPKIAHVITVDLPIAAQLRPNDRVRFRLVDLAEACALYRERENNFARFRVGLNFRS